MKSFYYFNVNEGNHTVVAKSQGAALATASFFYPKPNQIEYIGKQNILLDKLSSLL